MLCICWFFALFFKKCDSEFFIRLLLKYFYNDYLLKLCLYNDRNRCLLAGEQAEEINRITKISWTNNVLFLCYHLILDAQYTSYYPQYHQPLHMLLGKPLHLEVRLLNSPDPSLVLLVHFCVAYPRSGKAAWVLLYNGYARTPPL